MYHTFLEHSCVSSNQYIEWYKNTHGIHTPDSTEDEEEEFIEWQLKEAGSKKVAAPEESCRGLAAVFYGGLLCEEGKKCLWLDCAKIRFIISLLYSG